jgi:hypothetical protein
MRLSYIELALQLLGRAVGYAVHQRYPNYTQVAFARAIFSPIFPLTRLPTVGAEVAWK